jgi:integrase/recombinase XerD
LAKFRDHFPDHDLASVSPEEVLTCLTSLNGEFKQLTKHTRYAYLKALFNFIRNNLDIQLQNHCDTPMLKKLFRPGKLAQWQIPEKETIDEIIFRTTKARNRAVCGRGSPLMRQTMPGCLTSEKIVNQIPPPVG